MNSDEDNGVEIHIRYIVRIVVIPFNDFNK